MSIYFSGTISRSAGEIAAITKQLRRLNLKQVNRIQVQFDPFHPRAKVAREFLSHIATPSVAELNLNCVIKANVVCDRSEPEIRVDLADSGCVKFLTGNLTVFEILQQFNKHISSKVPVEDAPKIISTKAEKKRLKKR